jgi:hypothetical protein
MSCKLRFLLAVISAGLLLTAGGCGGGSSTSSSQATVSVSLGGTTLVMPQDGTAATLPVNVTVTGAGGSANVTVSDLPEGVTAQFSAVGGGPSGTLTFTGSANTGTSSGTYTPTVQATLTGGQSSTQSFTLVIAVVAKVGNAPDSTLGVNGRLEQFMATSFYVSAWDGDFFGSNPIPLENTMTALGTQHIRLQISTPEGVPMLTNTGTASDWDFSIIDRTVQPVLASADHSPELQLAMAPPWMCFSNGQMDVTNHAHDFAAYAANMVRYYNKGGFDWGGTHFQSPSNYPITWWGIFNEPNNDGVNVSAAQYTALYNIVVPAMLAVDPTIKFSALEFSDWGLGSGGSSDPMTWLPVFLAPANAGGVKTHVDILSTHLYSSCNQTDTDDAVFNSIPAFAANVRYFYQALAARPDLASLPVWVTENNVNADSNNNGMSGCNPGQVFVDDHRGTSAFFAAWRPCVFSQLGKAGNQALYQWVYSADQQNGEVDTSGNTYLSYWVDKSLASYFPSTPGALGPNILTLSTTDPYTVETLATESSTGAVTVMVADRAVHATTDNNGNGDPRTIIVDLSSLGSFSSASLLTIDAATSASAEPAAVSITPATRMTITLPGYGVALLKLMP